MNLFIFLLVTMIVILGPTVLYLYILNLKKYKIFGVEVNPKTVWTVIVITIFIYSFLFYAYERMIFNNF